MQLKKTKCLCNVIVIPAHRYWFRLKRMTNLCPRRSEDGPLVMNNSKGRVSKIFRIYA